MRDRKNDTAHRRVTEAKIGRKLKRTEIAHHVNEDKADNTPANLQAEERGKHTGAHNKNRGLSKLRASLRMVREKRRLY